MPILFKDFLGKLSVMEILIFSITYTTLKIFLRVITEFSIKVSAKEREQYDPQIEPCGTLIGIMEILNFLGKITQIKYTSPPCSSLQIG